MDYTLEIMQNDLNELKAELEHQRKLYTKLIMQYDQIEFQLKHFQIKYNRLLGKYSQQRSPRFPSIWSGNPLTSINQTNRILPIVSNAKVVQTRRDTT